MKYHVVSAVENVHLKQCGSKIIYPPSEKISSLVVDSFPLLGKLTALRFIEWVQNNPGGVISLPTGKTPEHFIKWTNHYLKKWDDVSVQKDLEANGIDVSKQPDMVSLHFVQIDEFFPISPKQQNSFYYYINRFYIKGFGIDPDKSLLIDTSGFHLPDGYSPETIFPDGRVDLSMRVCHPSTYIERIQKNYIHQADEYCSEYESKIRALGGIGFFLGGIGPDGHIGFNVSESDHYSTTRLTPINYETAAAAATDLGGIEISRHRLVITIGLATITFREDAVVIIIAAGDAKARIVAESIQTPKNISCPASVLQGLDNSRFYLTQGAASLLLERKLASLMMSTGENETELYRCLMDHCVSFNIPIMDVQEDKIGTNRFLKAIMGKNNVSLEKAKVSCRNRIIQGFQRGIDLSDNTSFLHTAPHHDDIMLAYLPALARLARKPGNSHHFAYMTSGFTSVTNAYMAELFVCLNDHIRRPHFEKLWNEGYFDSGNRKAYNDDVFYYLDAVAGDLNYFKREALAYRLARILIQVLDEPDRENMINRMSEIESYLKTQYPGKKDLEYIQKIKGMIREFEAELIWGFFGFQTTSVDHLRLGFYTGDVFTRNPEMSADVRPVLELIRKVKPDVITVALDPEGSGPDTHYKVLQTIASALDLYREETGLDDIRIWGYRNVWYRFHASEADRIIPVSFNSLAILESAFMNCFLSQKSASFPSYAYDGPFSGLAQRIYVEQYQYLRTLLGVDFFYNNPSSLLRSTRAAIYLKEMDMQEFKKHSLDLKNLTEESN